MSARKRKARTMTKIERGITMKGLPPKKVIKERERLERAIKRKGRGKKTTLATRRI